MVVDLWETRKRGTWKWVACCYVAVVVVAAAVAAHHDDYHDVVPIERAATCDMPDAIGVESTPRHSKIPLGV